MIAIAQKNSNLQIKLGFNSSSLEEYFTDNLGKGNGEAKISFLHFLLPSLSYHVYLLMLTIIRFTYFNNLSLLQFQEFRIQLVYLRINFFQLQNLNQFGTTKFKGMFVNHL